VQRPLTLIKRIFPSSTAIDYFYWQTARAGCASWQEKWFCVLPSALVDGWAAGEMKLFRIAFWLGVVVYNLPSPGSGPAAPESKSNGSQGVAVKAATQCPERLKSCAKYVEVPPKPGEPGEHSLPHDALRTSQDTLLPADRAVPWHRPAILRSRDRAPHAGTFS
jgi:hypothetical protein